MAKQTSTQYEHYEQVNLFSWLALKESKYSQLGAVYAVPNAARRSPRQGAWMKAEGMKAGVPDVVLPFVREGSDAYPGYYGGLYIEMKAPDKYPRPNQRDWADKLERNGMKVIRRCTTWQEAVRHILEYIGVEVTQREFPELFI